MEEHRETSKIANKHRHEHDIQVGNRFMISLRKHDAAKLPFLAYPWRPTLQAHLWSSYRSRAMPFNWTFLRQPAAQNRMTL